MKSVVDTLRVSRQGEPCVHRPRITFQDTNVVGNVYFLTYFRWQAECRDEWMRTFHPHLWRNIRSVEHRPLVTKWWTRFEDPFGATVGDDVAVTLSFTDSGADYIVGTAEVMKKSDAGSVRVATGSMTFTMRAEPPHQHNDYPAGPCYSFATIPRSIRGVDPLDLLGWQGKCRELFLADHAPDTLRLVAKQDVILQTTTASVDLVRVPPVPLDEVRVEMRLETMKCGQMGVQFDYFAEAPNRTSVHFATGHQTMSSKHNNGSTVVPCPFPAELLGALREFTESEPLLAKIDDILSFSSATASLPCDRSIAAAVRPAKK